MTDPISANLGRLVKLRNRSYVVTDLDDTTASAIPANDPAPSVENNLSQSLLTSLPSPLVSLASMDDEFIGEDLQVFWDFEVGIETTNNTIFTQPHVERFDPPATLDAFVNAIEWGATADADADRNKIKAPFYSGIEWEAYQLDPVVRAIDMPRVNLLIADDVGLGKTIEAGLVAQELILRHQVSTVLIVCPSALQIQWKEQMRDKFGWDFEIVDSLMIKELRRHRGIRTNPWSYFPRLITSIDFLKKSDRLRLLRETLPDNDSTSGHHQRRFDLLIVDECHNVAPANAGQYASDSQRTQVIRLLVPHFEHHLFLTATPHNGYPESFTALLEMIDNQRFARGVTPSPEELAKIMVRRLKSDIKGWDDKPRFPPRRLVPLEVAYTEEEKQAHAALKKYTALRIKGLAETNKREQFATEFVLKLLKKRLFSSPQAFLNTLQKHFETLHQNKTALNTRNPVATDQLTLAELQRQVDYLEEDDADDERYQEATEVVLEKTTQVFRPLSPEEQDLLTNMQQWASQAAQGGDRKVATLIAWLQENLKPQGQWNDTRVIIFTEYRDTQLWLTRQLEKAGFDTGQRVLLFYGGMESEKREQVKAAFQARPQDSLVRILIATDAASEGLDLQNHCSQLIHYEIPWNPSRLEQRNGRIDRHGQSAPEVKIYHFVAAGYQQGEVSTKPPGELAGDLEFLMRTVSKINKMREDLMGKVGQVIAEQVEEVMLGRRTRLDTAKSEQEAKSIQKLLKVEQDIKKRTQELHDQLHDIKSEMRLNSETLLAVIQEGLKIAGKPPLKEIDVPNLEGKAYEVPALGGSWKKCLQGLEDPLHKGELRPIVFDRDLAKKRDDVVLVHLNHRLAEMCLRVLRTTVWAEDNPRGLYRVTAKVVAEGLTDAPAIVAYSRLLMLSKRQRRLHEEIVTVGGIFREKNFEVLSQERCNRLLDKAQAGNIPQKVKQSLIELWPNYIEPLEAELKKYCEDRKGHLLKKLKERHEREKTDIRKVLQGLEANIKKRLADIDKRIEAEEESQQPSFFDDLERDQFERDQQALEIRLEEIPAELERELALINARYADPRPELIPLALVYLIPKKLSE